MGNKRISSDIKETALRLLESGWSANDICAALLVSPRSLYRWKQIFLEWGSVNRPESVLHGRPRAIAFAAMSACRQLYEKHPNTYLNKLLWFVAIHHDIVISLSALQSTLQKVGLTRKILHKIAIERDNERRDNWRNGIRDPESFTGTGEEFVFVDESSKNEHDVARRYGRAPAGQRAEMEEPFVHGVRYSVVAALLNKGYIATCITEGSFDSFAFFDYIVEDVVRAPHHCYLIGH